MKNGIEVRKNGAVIQRTLSGICYAVTLPDGTPSKNGPWDYLDNARRDADGEYPQIGTPADPKKVLVSGALQLVRCRP